MTDPRNPEPLTKVANSIEATAIVSLLSDNGIKATTTGDFTAGLITDAMGVVTVVVKSEDLLLAQKVLATYEKEGQEIETEDVEVDEVKE